MTHLPCRDVIPPMPCSVQINGKEEGNKKKPGQCFSVSGSSLAVGWTYSKYPYFLRTALCFSGMTFLWRDNASHPARSAVISKPSSHLACFSSSFFVLLQREALLLVLVRFDAFALTPELNTSFVAGARGAIAGARIFGSADWRWRGELLGNQGHTHHTWKAAEDLWLPTPLCPSPLPSLTAHQKWAFFNISLMGHTLVSVSQNPYIILLEASIFSRQRAAPLGGGRWGVWNSRVLHFVWISFKIKNKFH